MGSPLSPASRRARAGSGVASPRRAGRSHRSARRSARVASALRLASLVGLLLAAWAWLGLAFRVGPAGAGAASQVVPDLAYRQGPGADEERHRLDLFLPAEEAVPLLVFFHGGDWTQGDKNQEPGVLYEALGRRLSEAGVAVALVNYRLAGEGPDRVPHPAQAEDAAAALAFSRAWLIARGQRPTDLYAMGHEAGAHLAALLATNPRFLAAHGLAPGDLRGVIGVSGRYAVEPEGQDRARVFGEDAALRLDASPLHQLTRLGRRPASAFLLVTAADEHPGLAEEAERLAAALDEVDATVAREIVIGRDHESLMRRFGAPGDPLSSRVLAMIGATRARTPTPSPSATPRPTPTSTPRPSPSPTSRPVAPPGQAPDGPGGAARRHETLRSLRLAGALLRVPDDRDVSALPLLVFVPEEGRSGDAYAPWLDHVARGGNAVLELDPAGGAERVRARMDAALAALASVSDPPAVDTAWRVYAGHGRGAFVAARLASEWFVRRLPPPRGLLVFGPREDLGGAVLAPAASLPGDAYLVLVSLEGGASAPERAIWDAGSRIPRARRTHLRLRTDRHGLPWLEAGEHAPLVAEPGRLDALDWRGAWRWTDSLMACAREGRWCADAFGEPARVTDLGAWADGTPVRAAEVTEGPILSRVYLPSARQDR